MMLVLAVLAATPVPLSTLLRDADLIVVGTIVATDNTSSSQLAVEATLRGTVSGELAVQTALPIGERGIVLVGKKIPTSWLWESPRHRGAFGVRTALVKNDIKELRASSDTVLLEALIKRIGSRPFTLAERSGAFVISTECSACSLESSLQQETANTPGAVTCDTAGEGCVKLAWGRGQSVILRQGWTGIDSDGIEALVGTASAPRTLRFDSDTTGGRQPKCCTAVSQTKCNSVKWAGGRFICEAGDSMTLCNEWGSRRETLQGPLPIAEVCSKSNFTCPTDTHSALLCREYLNGAYRCSAR